MGRILRTSKARKDLSGIWAYIAQDDSDTATRHLRKLDQKVRLLSDTPSMGRERTDLADLPGLRSFPVDNYIIYYCPNDDGGVLILRVLHAARELDNLLGD